MYGMKQVIRCGGLLLMAGVIGLGAGAQQQSEKGSEAKLKTVAAVKKVSKTNQASRKEILQGDTTVLMSEGFYPARNRFEAMLQKRIAIDKVDDGNDGALVKKKDRGYL